jgi:predicted nuclease with TOPRIM domain
VEEKFQNHEERISKLEDNQKEINESMKDLKDHQQKTQNALLNIESTVMKESNSQKELLGTLISHHFNMKSQELNGKTEVSKLKWQTVTGLLGSGGFIVVIMQWIITLVQR